MMFDTNPSTEKVSSQVLFARSDFVFTAAALTLLAGFLVPFSARMLDIFWGLSLCFTMVLLLISFMAKNTSELSGFPLLMVCGALLRIVMAVVSAKLVIHSGIGGIIIESLGKPISQTSPVWIMIIIPIAAVVVVSLIYSSAKLIAKASLNFTFEILPLKTAGLKTDLDMGIINDAEAEQLQDRITRETQFYLNMAGVAKLLFCEAVIAGLVVIITIVGLASMSAIGRGGPDPAASLQYSAPLSAGSAVLTLLPSLIIALATAHLTGKNSLSLQTEKTETVRQQSKTIEIISNDTGQSEKVELLNPDFVKTVDKPVESPQSDENVASFEPIAQTTEETRPQELLQAQRSGSVEEYYNNISSYIDELPKDRMPVLFAAEGKESLPVTVAVNTAIRLTKKGHTCLLIDADPQRSAIAKVFDIPFDQIKNRALATCIDNLSIWTNNKLPDASIDSLKKVITAAVKKYDKVMIYAPNMNSAKLREKLPQVTASAIIFSAENENGNELRMLLDSRDCRTLAIMPPA
jgi:hypothetical protein